MWYEIIPVSTVIITALSIPDFFIYWTNRLYYGTPYRREVLNFKQGFELLRDERVSGINFAYKYVGLENIPDYDEGKGNSKEGSENEEMVCYVKKPGAQ